MAKRVAALITGCNGGIGQALCREFSAAGYLVIGTDLHQKKEADCDLYLSCDLLELATDSVSQTWFQNAICGFLDKQSTELKVVINNAALQITKPLSALSTCEFLASQQINVVAPFVLAKLFEELLRKARGSIVNIGSIHSKLTKPRFCAYSTSKAALSGLTRALALEFSGQVNVNVILPGATRTAMLLAGFREQPEKYQELESFQPAGRIAEPEEIAHLALFLCSPNARFITGSDFPIDGGIGGCLHDPI
jgi:NAD(P)-dependent dehydrogenase (short-subunit alcohol dehydrogenase family)